MKGDRERIIAETRQVLGTLYGELHFLAEDEAAVWGEERQRLLGALAPDLEEAFGASKPHLGKLSPGCRRCGEGRWSCLFVTRTCPYGCSFCPAPSTDEEIVPYADGLQFPDFDSFLTYVRVLGLDGVSLSGGEPLLAPERTIARIRRAREVLGPAAYLWLYTAGPRATAPVLDELAAAGLDEIRFNIGATDYELGHVVRAKGRVPRVTVEVPVVPEAEPTLAGRLREMAQIGVDHLHLHQMMIFGANTYRLLPRRYPLIHGPMPSPVESELGALRLLRRVRDEALELPTQYCATAFKARWQASGNQRRLSELVRRGGESVSAWGTIRRIRVPDGGDSLRDLASPSAHGGGVSVRYLRPVLVAAPDPAYESRELRWAEGGRAFVLLYPESPEIPLDAAGRARLAALAAGSGPSDPGAHPIDRFEVMPRGLPAVV